MVSGGGLHRRHRSPVHRRLRLRSGFTGAVQLAPGWQPDGEWPARRSACRDAGVPPDQAMLDAGYTCGAPHLVAGHSVEITVAGGTGRATVTNPTIAIFGRVSVTKAVTGETQGISGGAMFDVAATCSTARPIRSTSASADRASRRTSRSVPPARSPKHRRRRLDRRLVRLGADAIDQNVTSPTGPGGRRDVTNPVIRVRGQLIIAKALVDPESVVDPAREYTMGYGCQYGNEPAVAGTVPLSPAARSATVAACSSARAARSSRTRPHWPAPPDPATRRGCGCPRPTRPEPSSSARPPCRRQRSSPTPSDQLTRTSPSPRSVTGSGKDGGYTPGDTFTFTDECDNDRIDR